MTIPQAQREQLDRLQWWALVVGGGVLLVCFIAGFFVPAQFSRAYLSAYLFYFSIGQGCLLILMVYHLTGGAWGFLVRRILEAGTRTLPLLALLFVPIACCVGYLFIWAQPEQVEASESLQHKAIYLNVPFFLFRAALFFAIWITIAFFLNRWSRKQDETGNGRLALTLERLSGPGLVIYGITTMFTAVDWIMSLQPAFRSSIIGPLFASGHAVAGQSCAIIVLAWLIVPSTHGKYISLEALNDLGNLLFTFLIVWAYMNFFQFMLIWIANLDYDIIWYLPRMRGGWLVVAWVLIVFHFAVPFFLLLMRDVKRNPRFLAGVAGLLLVMHLVYEYQQVLPAFPNTSILEHWIDFLTPVGIGGVWLACFLWNLKRYPLLPLHDASQKSAMHLQELDEEETKREEVLHHD